jgi:hypothetical protein
MTLNALVRKVLRIPEPRFSADQALEIAQRECANRGLGIGHAVVVERLRTWLVWVDSARKGCPWVLVDQQSGEIVKFSQLPR